MKSVFSLVMKLKDNKNASKSIENASWLIIDKVITMVIGVFVMGLVARYLGPENYGLYNYSLAFVTLFTAFSTLGLETLTIKSIVQKEDDEGTIIFTSIVLRVLGGFLLTFLSTIVIRLVEPEEPLVHMLVIIMSVTMIFKSLEVIEYWIQAYQKSKISSIIRIGASIISAVFKVLFVVLEGSLIYLAFIYLLDALIIGIALTIAYFKNRHSSVHKWRFKVQYAKNVLSLSWYLILSSFMATLYMQMDKVMLGTMLINTEELGIYSAATQIATMWYFIPIAVITTFKPIIMKEKKENKERYINSVQRLYSIVVFLGIGFGLIILATSKIIIGIIYGEEYLRAASILSVSIWAGTFALLGTARGAWLVCEGLQKYSVLYIGAGAIVNILLNYFLIPIMGGLGAAIATLVAQITVALIAPGLIKKTRVSSIMMLKAFKLEGLFIKK